MRRLAALLAGLLAICQPLSASPQSAATYSRKHRGDVLLIWNNGRTFSDLRPGFSLNQPFPVLSITKSLTAMAWLSRYDDTKVVFPAAASRSPVRASHLLSQTSGWNPGYSELYRKSIRDIWGTAIRLPRGDPGKRFEYGPAHYEVLGSLLGESHGAESFLKRLGIQPAAWRRDRKGQPFSSAGACLSAEDLLRIGRLILERGRIGGFQFVIPARRLDQALRGTPANPAYGYGFWLNRQSVVPGARESDVEVALAENVSTEDWSRFCLSRSAPADLICLAGSGGQRVYVIPSQRTVIIRLGRSGGGFRDSEFLRALASASRAE